MVSSPSQSPPSAGVVYSKIGTASLSSLEYSSGKSGVCGHEDVHHNKVRAFCAGYGGRAIACVLAVLGICLLVILLSQIRHRHNKVENQDKPGQPGSPLSAPSPVLPPLASVPVQALSLASLCNTTTQSQLCLRTLSAFQSTQSTAALQDLTAFVAQGALECLNETYMLAVNLSQGSRGSSDGEKAALQDCLELLDQARDGLRDSISRLSHLVEPHRDVNVRAQVMDVQVWMSSSYTNQDTCWDGFEDVEGPVKDMLLKSGQPIAPLIAMALSFAKLLQEVGLSTLYALHPSP